jgi:hypothetical protein
LDYKCYDDFDVSNLKINTTGADYDDRELEKFWNDDRLKKLAKIIDEIDKDCRHNLIFCSSIRQASRCADMLKQMGHSTAYLSSDMNMKERDSIISRFRSGEIKHLCNVGILTCLSEETEVLSKRGWLKKDEVTLNDMVAQYENGIVTFEKPTRKHEHNHIGDMVGVDGRYVTFKVTSDHNMLVKTGITSKFNKKKAKDIVGKVVFIPVSGFGVPDKIIIPQKTMPRKGRFIAQNSYNYRKGGLSEDNAYKLGLKQWEHKSKLKYKNPEELTLDECRFIGFWLGDGSVSSAKTGGKAYTLTQSFRTPKILSWIENILNSCNISFRHYDYKGGQTMIMGIKCNAFGYRTYLLNKGTGGNNQQKEGLYSLIPYLVKAGTHYLNGLNREQYFALMEGLFTADGCHGDNKKYSGGKIAGEYKGLFDLLQSIGVCRGYRVTVKPIKMRKNNKKQLYSISLYDKTQHQLRNDRAVTSPSNGSPVWCLTMSKGTLVTRNKGTVTIMGNTGFDFPGLDTITLARPTLSLALLYQQCGRGFRTDPQSPGKRCKIIDLTSNILKLGRVETIDILPEEGGWKDTIVTERGVISGQPLFTFKVKDVKKIAAVLKLMDIEPKQQIPLQTELNLFGNI